MTSRHTLATGLSFLLMTIGASAEIVYSGVKNLPLGGGGAIGWDLDADGTVDFATRYGIRIANYDPTTSWGGAVELELRGRTRALGSNELGVRRLGALPMDFSVGAQSQSFSWLGPARYALSVGSWSDGVYQPWSGWTKFAGAKDPV